RTFPVLLSLSALFGHEMFLYHDAQCRGQNIQGFTMQGKNFAVDHYIYRRIQFEVNALCLPSLGQGVIDVCPVVEGREIADKADTANWPPAHIFNQAIVDIGIGCDHHRTASKFAIAKGQEKTASVVELLVAIYT